MMFRPVKMERYQVLERLGSGVFGETFKAIALEDISERCPKDTLVTIKSFFPEQTGLYKWSTSFTKESHPSESQIIKPLSEPECLESIPCFIENFTWTDSLLRTGEYMVSFFIPGVTLRTWLIDNPDRSIEQSYDICRQLFKSVAIVHRHGLAHNDIHLDNVLISPDNRLYLIDFGIASSDEDWEVDEIGYEGVNLVDV